jgi:DNA mismatch repair protein MutS2
MENSSLEMLEFPKIREILAGFTSFSASRELAISLRPSSNFEMVSLLLKQSGEARHLLSLKPGFSIGGATDICEAVRMAAKDKVLDPKVLTEIRETLATVRVLRNNLKRLSPELPALWDIAGQIVEKPKIEDEIGRCITAAGEIADSASTKLAGLRRQLKDARQRLYEKLEVMLKSKSRQKFIQEEPFITEREGRYVIPVKAEFRKEIKGIVHDISNTGATVFVEPWETVELGNELRQAVIEEKQEMERILMSLSAQVAADEVDICHNVELMAEIDLALAKARYAEKINGTEPIIINQNDENNQSVKPAVLKLVKARHPLLRGKVVPLNVEIGRDFSILIITGPNTGGKTVAIKTIGLLTLMAQAGMPIPASDESCIPIFDSIFADIGDQQSIEETLSTFSWHIGNIVRIIHDSTQNSLVLLDELGISTDPGEGSALARAILLHFLARGTTTVATTHYSDLKAFAHTTSGMQNASLDFDTVTLAPTYHLTIGTPGRSNALSIASQLGLAQEIIASAKKMLSQGSQEMDSLLSDLVRERQKLEVLNSEMEEDRDKVENLKNHLEQESQRLKEQERVVLQEVKDRLLNDAASLQKLIRDAESELRKAKKRESIERAKKSLEKVHNQMADPAWQAKASPSGEILESGSISVGDRVSLTGRNLEGTVLALVDNGSQLEVQVGNFKLIVGIEEIEKTGTPADDNSYGLSLVKKRQSRKLHSLELDLRGKRADEVYGLLDRYLNDAFLSRLSQVRIIHGYATGTVRQVVREMLASHPLVKSFQPGGKDEGGDGVTMVQL